MDIAYTVQVLRNAGVTAKVIYDQDSCEEACAIIICDSDSVEWLASHLPPRDTFTKELWDCVKSTDAAGSDPATDVTRRQ